MPNNSVDGRGPPGPPVGPNRMGGPGGKDSLWGPTRPQGGGGWGEGPDAGGMGHGGPSGGPSGWGDMDKGGRDGGGGWPDNSGGWGNPRSRNPGMPPGGNPQGMMHRSGGGGPGSNWGDSSDDPTDGGGWSSSSIKTVGPAKKPNMNDMSNMLWNSKPFRMLCDMGASKEDAENALRITGGNVDEALEMLQSSGRIMRGGPPGGADSGPGGMYGGGGRGGSGMDSNRFPGPNMPYGGSGGPQDPSGLGSNPGLAGNFPTNPMLQKGINLAPGPGSGSGGLTSPGMPPSVSSTRPTQQQQNSQPSAQQLRMLVQQIQMAVQAGHLNPQILNQPLAPQTLILLNQLLQQIKNLQALQQQHGMAQTQKGMGNSNNLLAISVNITKTKQHITNLQNQISAQQATYLKGQMGGGPGSGGHSLAGGGPIPPVGGGSAIGGGSGGTGSSLAPSNTAEQTMPDLFNALSMSSSSSGTETPGGSRLSQWKLPESAGDAFSTKSSTSKVGFGVDDTWGVPSSSTSSGWPDSKNSDSNSAATSAAAMQALNGIGDSFGIPEFEPGKPWKGNSLKNPDEDPNLTPGSVANTAIDLMTKSSLVNNAASTTSLVGGENNTLGLTSPTWSFSNTTSMDNKPKDSWGNNANTGAGGNGAGGSGNTGLTQMGQDLWGAKSSSRTPPGLGASGNNNGGSAGSGGSGWPVTSAATSSSNGWSTGQNGAASSASGEDRPAWLLLKNLTPQIDGSTLKTLCLQHGPLKAFHLFLNNSIALVMYATGREANKAQKALNNCLLGNTTINATLTSDAEAANILQQLGGGQQSATNATTPSTSTTSGGLQLPKSSNSNDMWSVGGNVPTSMLSGSSVWGAPSVSSEDARNSTPQLQPYLPGDLLGESNM